MPTALAKNFVTLMLTCETFAVANLLVDTRLQEVVDICLETFDCIGGSVKF